MSPGQVYLGVAGVCRGKSTQNPKVVGVYPESQMKDMKIYGEYKLEQGTSVEISDKTLFEPVLAPNSLQ